MKNPELCNTKWCKRKRRKKSKDCNTCHGRKVHSNNPLRTAWRNLKKSAKRRKIVFNLCFEDFFDKVKDTEYLSFHGKTYGCFTIDRIEDLQGYTKDNIQILTVEDNTIKRNFVYGLPIRHKIQRQEAETPF